VAKVWALVLAAGVLTGFLAWAHGEHALDSMPTQYVLTPEQLRAPDKSVEMGRQNRANTAKIAMFTYGVLGGLLGLALGVAGGLAAHSLGRSLAPALIGMVLAGGTTAAVTKAAVPTYYRAVSASEDNLSSDMVVPLIFHGSMWICAGAFAGGAFGFALGGWSRAIRGVIGGAIGALCATVVYDFMGALFFPLGETTGPISTAWTARLIAVMGVATFTAAGALFGTGSEASGRS
jgi:hypothetical protein